MRRRPVIFSVIGATLAALAVGGIGVMSASAQAEIPICHRTDSATNPYVSQLKPVEAVDGIAGNSGQEPDHFGEHTGPLASSEAVAQSLKDNKIEWGDIIPPIPGVHGGLNFTAEGQAILENDCKFAAPPVTTEAPPVTTAKPPVTPAVPAAPAAAAAVAAVPRVTG
jgi:hypothetical protein